MVVQMVNNIGLGDKDKDLSEKKEKKGNVGKSETKEEDGKSEEVVEVPKVIEGESVRTI